MKPLLCNIQFMENDVAVDWKPSRVSNVQEVSLSSLITNMLFFNYQKNTKNRSEMWRSPHAPQALKENKILSVQYRDDDEEDGDQKAEEENHGLDDHACRGEMWASGPHRYHSEVQFLMRNLKNRIWEVSQIKQSELWTNRVIIIWLDILKRECLAEAIWSNWGFILVIWPSPFYFSQGTVCVVTIWYTISKV